MASVDVMHHVYLLTEHRAKELCEGRGGRLGPIIMAALTVALSDFQKSVFNKQDQNPSEKLLSLLKKIK